MKKYILHENFDDFDYYLICSYDVPLLLYYQYIAKKIKQHFLITQLSNLAYYSNVKNCKVIGCRFSVLPF